MTSPDILRAETCMREHRFDEAIAIYKDLTDRHPGDDSYLLALAWAYHDSGKTDEAVACFDALLNKELSRRVFTGFAFDELVRIFKETGQFERLIDVCERAVVVQPDDITLLGEMGNAYLKAGKPRKAIEVYTRMTGMEPEASAFFCLLGNALVTAGHIEDAITAYDRAMAIDPSESAPFLFLLANILMENGYDETAERTYERCIEYHIAEPLYHCALGDCQVRQGKIDDALISYENAVRLNAESAGVSYNRLGNCLAGHGFHREATEAFRKAIGADPGKAFYFVRLAESCMAIGRLEEAEKILKELDGTT